jgi:hypothetical protein
MDRSICLNILAAVSTAVLLTAPVSATESESIGTEARYDFKRYWMKNCSILGMTVDGAKRTLVHYKPESGELSVARQIPVLFEGTRAKDTLRGR